MNDYISRKAVVDLLKKCTWGKTQREAMKQLEEIEAYVVSETRTEPEEDKNG